MAKSGKRGRPTKAPKAGERVPLGLRVTAEMKRKLDAASERSGRSQSQEAEFRMERSFSEEDAFGGPELRRMAIMMAASFGHAGHMHAGQRPAAEWLKDPDAYQAAVIAVVTELLIWMPDAAPERVAMLFEAVKGRVITHFVNRTPRQ